MGSIGFVCFVVILVVSSGLVQSLQRRSEDSSRNSTACSHCSAPTITSILANQTEIVGKKIFLKCYAKGRPLPNITWYKDGKRIDSSNKGRIVIRSIDHGSRLKIKTLHKTDSGKYYCNATNSAGAAISNAASILVKGVDWNKTINTTPTSPYNTGEFNYPLTQHPGYCVHYTGKKCSAYINRHKSIHIKPDSQQSGVENKLQNALDSFSKSKQLSDKCEPYVLPVLCHFLFPYCDELSADPKPRTLCHEECKLLRDDICMMEYKMVSTLLHVLIPDCAVLPKKDSPAGKNCIPLPLVFARPVRYKEQKG